ncbi:hypothetical protein QJ054_34155 [Streptomyces sp. AN-3]|uniref:hypothetical protein n=1 Tax=Streptomyces sp. AN-3 TaxID=3044177 RepID=UPI00249C8F94|nr:hypothetical protein [Streptomyces sp. AN-3]MDI3102082.1 hypothetical protein [Streptomyces sp. AN-3]MDV6291328.1 hypothetical protein [Streptomyces sp. UP1A-1]
MTRLVYGPHCPHDECGWLGCDHEEGRGSGIVFPCRYEHEGCPYCGPADKATPIEPGPERHTWVCATCGLTLTAGSPDALEQFVGRYGARHVNDHESGAA